MKKCYFCALIFLLSLAGKAQVQNDGSPYPHKTGRDTQPLTLKVSSRTSAKGNPVSPYITDVKNYGIVRIGEYYWINRNFSNNKATQWQAGGDWNNWWEEVAQNLPTQPQLDKYLGHMGLPKDKFQITDMGAWNHNDFNENYGSYYHAQSIFGNWVGQFIQPMEAAFETSVNNVKDSRWGLPTVDDFKQLFGMIEPDVIAVNEIHVRHQLGPLAKDNAEAKTKTWLTNKLAYNMGPSDGDKVYWFEGTTNRYGFNLMPNGGRANGTTWYQLHDRPGWQLDRGDFSQLFYVSKFAAKQANGEGASIDLHDFITFYPKNPGENVAGDIPYSYGTWYGVRYCKRLTPQELGYEVYYIPGKHDKNLPDYDEPLVYIAWKNSDGTIPAPKGKYQVLPAGYFRGFFTQFEIYEGNPKNYRYADYVKMARCIQDETLMKKMNVWNESMRAAGKDECDCNTLAPIYLKDHMQVMTDKPFSYALSPGESFSVLLETTSNKDVNIGLYKKNTKTGEIDFVGQANIGEADQYGVYQCLAVDENGSDLGIGIYIVQPFRYGLNGEIIKVERKKEDAHLIDRLPINVSKYKTTFANTYSAPADEADFEENMIIRVLGRAQRDIFRYVFSGETPEIFTVTVPVKDNRDFKIGLFSRYGEILIDDIRKDPSSGNTSNPTHPIRCQIPIDQVNNLTTIYDWVFYNEVTTDLSDVEINTDMESKHIVAAYYPENGSYNPQKGLITRKNSIPYIDRIPVYMLAKGEGPVIIPNLRQAPASALLDEVSAIELFYDRNSQLVKANSLSSFITDITIYSFNTATIVRKGLNTSQVNVADLPSGVYIVKITDSNKETKSLKFIK